MRIVGTRYHTAVSRGLYGCGGPCSIAVRVAYDRTSKLLSGTSRIGRGFEHTRSKVYEVWGFGAEVECRIVGG